MEVLDRNSSLWNYLPEDLRQLFEDGELILTFIHSRRNPEDEQISDYSFMVFPFAKAYEGFLKRFFLDTNLISETDYYGEEIRIGRILNPGYKEKDSLFDKLCGRGKEGRIVSRKLWQSWKRGRNLVFHFFPHNYRRLSYEQALDTINELIDSMDTAVNKCGLSEAE